MRRLLAGLMVAILVATPALAQLGPPYNNTPANPANGSPVPLPSGNTGAADVYRTQQINAAFAAQVAALAANALRSTSQVSNVVGATYPSPAPSTDLPTVTLNAATSLLTTQSQITSAQAFYAMTGTNTAGGGGGGSVNTTYFTYRGGAVPALATQAVPNYAAVQQVDNTTSTDRGSLAIEFGVYTTQLEVPWFGGAGALRIIKDGVEVLRSAPSTLAGTAQAGSSTTITLAAGASAANGTYNKQWVYIDSGTGAGNFAQITGYVGSTKVATVNTASGTWSAPDATSVYDLRQTKSPFAMPGTTGGITNVLLTWPTKAFRKIRLEIWNDVFYGVRIGPTDSIWKTPPVFPQQMVVVGDSFPEGSTGNDNRWTGLGALSAEFAGYEPRLLVSGGTGYVNGSVSNGRMTVVDRLIPPPASFIVSLANASGGTYTLSFNGATTTAIAYNATPATVQAALEAIVGVGNVVCLQVVNVPGGIGLPVLFRGTMAQITTPMTANFSGLTGGAVYLPPVVTQYTGDLAPYIPRDGSGNPLPFTIELLAGHNDTVNSGAAFTPASVQTAVTTLLQTLRTNYPQATIVMTGSLLFGTPDTASLNTNAALLAAAQAALPSINGTLPFVDTLTVPWATGNGNIGVPSGTGNGDFFTWTDGIHPYQDGQVWYGQRLAGAFGPILATGAH